MYGDEIEVPKTSTPLEVPKARLDEALGSLIWWVHGMGVAIR